MADKVSIATGTDKAIARLVDATSSISSALGVDALVIPPKHRDHDYQNMVQLVAVADWVEALARTLDGKAAKERKGK